MTWKTLSTEVVARPATDMVMNRVIDPAIHSAALRFDGSGDMRRYLAGQGHHYNR
jgi:hypothetical protein